MRDKHGEPEPRHPTDGADVEGRDDDVIRIEDLAPRGNVSGGRKILLGEVLTPMSNPRIVPES